MTAFTDFLAWHANMKTMGAFDQIMMKMSDNGKKIKRKSHYSASKNNIRVDSRDVPRDEYSHKLDQEFGVTNLGQRIVDRVIFHCVFFG